MKFIKVLFLLSVQASEIEQPNFEIRVKQAETILFGRFNWMVPINNNDHVHQVFLYFLLNNECLNIIHQHVLNTRCCIVFMLCRERQLRNKIPA